LWFKLLSVMCKIDMIPETVTRFRVDPECDNYAPLRHLNWLPEAQQQTCTYSIKARIDVVRSTVEGDVKRA
jgi:hypothetical protein